MFKQIADFVASLLFLARDTAENKNRIVALERSVADLALHVEQIASELRHLNDRERIEREKLMLQVENALLRLQAPVKEKKRARRKT